MLSSLSRAGPGRLVEKRCHASSRLAADARDTLRLAANVSYFAWLGGLDESCVDIPADIVPQVYLFLRDVHEVIGLIPEDLLFVAVYLSRYFDAVMLGEVSPAVVAYHYQTSLPTKVLHAVYLSQTQLYDDPLCRQMWLSVTINNETWGEFVQDALTLASAFDYELVVCPDTRDAALDALIHVIEPDATILYNCVATGAPLPALTTLASLSSPEPSSPLLSALAFDQEDDHCDEQEDMVSDADANAYLAAACDVSSSSSIQAPHSLVPNLLLS